MFERHVFRRCAAAIILGVSGVSHAAFATDDIIKIGYHEGPHQYNPAYAKVTETGYVLSNVYDTLVRQGDLSGFTGGLAERWQVSEDARVFDFWIRDNAAWSDGTPIDAHYAAESFELLGTLPDNANFIDFSEIEISVLQDDNNQEFLRFVLDEPSSEFFAYLAYVTTAVLPVHKADEVDFATRWETFESAPQIYSGPYILADVRGEGEQISLRPNPAYHSSQWVVNGGVDLNFFDGEDIQAINAIRAGTLDAVGHRSSGQSDYIEATMQEFIRNVDEPVIDMLFINTETPALQEPEVRRAIAQIANLSEETSFTEQNNLVVGGSFVPTRLQTTLSMPLDEASRVSADTAMEEARAAMVALGFGPENRLRVDFAVNKSMLHERMANLMRVKMRQIFVDANIVVTPWSEHQVELREGNFEIARYGWRYDIAHPSNLFEILTSGNPYNFVGYANPEYDRIVQEMGQAFDSAQLAALVEEAETILSRDVPALPLYQRNDSLLVHPDLIMGEYNFAGHQRFDQIQWRDSKTGMDQS